MSARIVPNGPGIGQMLKEGWVQAAMHARAERVASAARSIAPVGETGAYQASIHVVDEMHSGRAASHVVVDVEYGMVVEANTGTLARALSAAG